MSTTNRRDFLKISATVSGGALVAGPSLGEVNTAGVKVQEGYAFQLNGSSVLSQKSPKTPLAQVLREEMGHTGTKTYCESGVCGACTVRVNGQARHSCMVPVYKVAGQQIQTIEGLKQKSLHEVQQAFIDADALQCGFCTPGMIMSAAAFIESFKAKSPGKIPETATIEAAMSGNLCRCGAQPKIFHAIENCFREHPLPGPMEGVCRQDAHEKVTGDAEYAFDYYPEGVLYVAVLRATHAFGRVTNIDLQRAEKMPGVVATMIYLPKLEKGYGKIRWVGQEIAAVAAETQIQANAALREIRLELEENMPSIDPTDAALPRAPAVWNEEERGQAANAQEGPGMPSWLFQWEGNVRGPARWESEAETNEAVIELQKNKHHINFKGNTGSQSHMPLERHGCVVQVKGKDLVVVASTQTVQILATSIAEAFDWDEDRVKVISPFVGGGFGCKAVFRPEYIIATRFAIDTGRPVRLFYDVGEHLLLGGNRPGTKHHLDLGADSQGRIKAIVHQNDSYCGSAVGETSSRMTQSHYPNAQVHTLDRNVTTHTPPSCAFRAPAHPPNAFALEQTVDMLAQKVGKDALQLRIENEDRERHLGVYRLLQSKLTEHSLQEKSDRTRFLRGQGVATAEWFQLCAPNTKVKIEIVSGNKIKISTASQDMGQGTRTSLTSLAVKHLGLEPSQIDVKVGRSDLPTAPGSFGSITTSSIAPTLVDAMTQLKEACFKKISKNNASTVLEKDGVKMESGLLLPWRDLIKTLPSKSVFTGRRTPDLEGFSFPPKIFNSIAHFSPFAMAKDIPSSAQAVTLEVDRLLGTIRILSVDVAIDSGTLASPVTAHSQVVGGVIQGLSYALFEDRLFDRDHGRLLNNQMEDYKILGMSDLPEVRVHFYDKPSPNNPVGSLGIGENCTIATCAAVANAFARATGHRATQTPLTPQYVLSVLNGGAT